MIEYLVRVDLDKLGIDETMFEELQALFKMFDLDSDGVLSLAEFGKVLTLLGQSGSNCMGEFNCYVIRFSYILDPPCIIKVIECL